MKSEFLIISFGLFLISIGLSAQSPQNQNNYIQSTTLIKKEKNSYAISGLSASDKNVTISYFDGLGRPIQNVSWQASPTNKDIIEPIVYDAYGRQEYQLLPYQSSVGSGQARSRPDMDNYHGSPSEHKTFYSNTSNGVVTDAYPYSKTVFENSPLSRVLQQGAPGADWQPDNHPIRYSYETNHNSYDVILFKVVDDKLVNFGGERFSANELFKTVIKDEHWSNGQLHTTEEYKNKMGQVVLKRSYVRVGTISAQTYYIYDDFGLLRFVLPPKSVYEIAHGSTSQTDTKIITGKESLSGSPDASTYLVTTGGSLTLTSGFSFKASANQNFTASAIKGSGDLIYAYKYDERKRMIEKKIPGAAVVYMVYDERDRLVATQDGEQRKNNQWLFTKYDVLNRPILTGLWTQTTTVKTRDALQSFVNTYYDPTTNQKPYEVRGAIVHGYTNQSFPSVPNISNYLTVTYYDDYAWHGAQTAVNTYFNDLKIQFNSHGFAGVTVPSIIKFDSVKGLVTGTKEKILDSTNEWLSTITFYDDRYRPILVRSDNYVGGEDIILNHYDFPGQLLESWVCHKTNLNSPGIRILRQKNDYDQVGRLLTTKQQMTGATNLVTIAENSYNELGQLKNKKIGNAIQEMDYKYNIRGWLTQINNPEVSPIGTRKFAMRLRYNDPVIALSAQPQYNGNISAIEWRTPSISGGSSDVKQGYGFSYDALNRLQTSVYAEGTTYTSNKNRFNESITGYDLNGNIEGLIRRLNNQEVDRLGYFYDLGGNQLARVADSAPVATRSQGFMDGNTNGNDYSYDLNGNMTIDKNKGIGKIEYNYLNLPKKIIDQNDISKTIEYIYSANGQKLQKRVGSETTHYSGSFIYEGTSLKQLMHSEGYVDMSGTPAYHYYLKDHLGNNRMVVNQSGTVVQQTDYYPFGMAFNKGGSTENKYLYNGKELQEDAIGNGLLDWYDYGARMYDPALGRWHVIDPLAEKYIRWSPYHYTYNNPIRFIDLDGRKIGDRRSQDTKRYRASVRRTEVGKQVWRELRKHPSKVYFHYVGERNGNIHYGMKGANGAMMSGEEFRAVNKTGEQMTNSESNTFNKATGKWERNDKSESHVVINVDNSESFVTSQEITGNIEPGNSEFEKDAHIHNVEVHEGAHVVQDGYDYTVVDEDGNDTGVGIPHSQRQSEIEAFEDGNRSEEELRNQ